MPCSQRSLRSPLRVFALGGLAAALLWPSDRRLEAAQRPAWRVVRGDVRVLCPMTVGGSFEARTRSLTGTLSLAAAHPDTLDGELSVELDRLDTGIALRDEHLRDGYLEVGKDPGFVKAVLSGIQLPDADAETFQGRTRFSGTFQLHGARRQVLGQAEIRRQGSRVRVEASFPVTLADYGIAKPQYLGVGVKEQVRVEVTLLAEPEPASSGASR